MRQIEPTVVTKGERVEWAKSYSDYSAATYTLEYRFRSSVGPGVNVTATADGSEFNAVLTAGQSATLEAGIWYWQAWLTESGDVTNTFIAGSGRITVKEGFGTTPTSAVDMRSVAKQTLDSIDAALLAFAGSNVQEYEISTPAGTRRVKRSSTTDLLTMRKHFAGIVGREIAMERVRNGGPLNKVVVARLREI
jgi:hypothetical protein